MRVVTATYPTFLLTGIVRLPERLAQNWLRAAAAVLLLLVLATGAQPGTAAAVVCEHWVAPAPEGSDTQSGSETAPWATLSYAAANVPDDRCTVWIKSGTYTGLSEIERRFETPTAFRAVEAYTAVFENNGTVLKINGARNVQIEGLELRHAGQAESKHVVIADRSGDLWAENIILRNNIIHDSTSNDLLKLNNGVRFATVEGNLFYNQSASEQHMDVNSVTDIVIQDNIFFNDFAGSGREDPGNSKHFIVVKDSNEGSDGQWGSERITIHRNIFLNWQGGRETFIQIGNDGKRYHEARDVLVENNLMVGNGSAMADATFGVRGAINVLFAHNTIVGDLPAKAYAFRVSITGENPRNENVQFHNNIWADSTGTMGSESASGSPDFSNGYPEQTTGLILDNNLYWNGGAPIPQGDLVNPLEDDLNRIVADPGLETDQTAIVLPRWTGTQFLSGSAFIREEFERLVMQYGRIPQASPAIDQANPDYTPSTDILQNTRGALADLGAFEYFNVILNLYKDGSLRWMTNLSGSCTESLYRSDTPYVGHSWLTDAPAAYDGSGSLTDVAVNYFYYLLVDCDGSPAQSNEVGEFTFGIVPGSP